MAERKTKVAGALLALLLGALHGLWLPPIGEFLVTGDPLQPADAIVPLAGERSRVFHAAELFRLGYARWFVITDMWVANPNPVTSYAEAVAGQAMEASVPRDRILTATGAVASTYQEAMNLRGMSQREGWRSLIVVTSPFHTRRAKEILQDAFRETGVAVIVRPVPNHWYSVEHWWATPDGIQTTLEEYMKLALYRLGYHHLFER